jgi:precorrin-2 dehydrogenase / sirohydrochlorin ferrochelatase
MPAYLPLYIDMSGRRVVIFGGGPVGERKARYFLPAEVIVVSRDFTEGLEALGRDGTIKLVRMEISKDNLDALVEGAFVAVAATGELALDEEIRHAAEKRHILMNSTAGDSPVIVPSLVRKGPVMVAISTGGSSPALSKYLRQRLESSIGDDVEKMAALQERLRKRLKALVDDQKQREKLLRDVLEDPAVWKALGESPDAAYEAALGRIEAGR